MELESKSEQIDSPKAKTIWGARIDSEQKGTVSVTAVMTGVECTSLRKREKHLGPIKLW